MSTFDYNRMRATTLRLLKKFGNDITLVREDKSPGDYDPDSGQFPAKPDIIVNGTGALFDFLSKEIDGTNVIATDRKLLFQGEELNIDDKFNNWRVHDIDNLDPDESGTILTTAQMRK